MKISSKTIEKLTISGIDGIDTLGVYLEDFGGGRGRLVVECFGEAWSSYWPAMGSSLIDFIIGASSVDYIANKLKGDVNQREIDESELPKSMSDEDVDLVMKGCFPSSEACSMLKSKFGSDWPMDLPQTNTHDYEYLLKIVSVVREALVIHANREELKC